MAKDKPYYRIRAQAGQTPEVFIYGDIGTGLFDEGTGARQLIEEVNALGPIHNLKLRINSPGGSVFEGQALYSFFRNHPATIHVMIDGVAASIASVVAMCGDSAEMPKNATLMIHDPWTMALGNAADMRKAADALDTVKLGIIAAYMDKSGLDEQTVSDLMTAETWMTAEQALNYGFIDRITEPVKMAASANFNFSRFRKTPEYLINGGSKNMEDKNLQPEDGWKTDKYQERSRVTGLLEIGRMFDCGDLASRFIVDGKSEDDLRLAILAKQKSGNQEPFITVESRAAGKPFDTFGNFLMSVKAAGTPGKKTDPRLFYNAASGGNEAVPSDGGFAVQTDFSSTLLEKTYEESILAQRCTPMPISSGANGIKLPVVDEQSRVTGSRWGGVQMYWAGEADSVTAKKPKLAQLELKLHKLMGISYLTEEVMEDSGAMEALVNTAFTSEASWTIDDCIMNGDGAGKPLGFTASNAVVTVNKETGQLADTIQYENITKMWSRLWGRGEKNSVWLINRDVLPQLFTMTVGTGASTQPVYMPPTGASGSPYGTIFGRPVISMEQCSTLGTAGDIMLIDPSQYMLANKGGLKMAMSIHVRFVYDENCFKFTYRVDGQPIWKAPLTPASGSANTLSPFVMLQSRT